MVIRYEFRHIDGSCIPVTLEISNPEPTEVSNLWACSIEWSGFDLPGKRSFGDDPLGAVENALTIARSVVAMVADTWRATPMSARNSSLDNSDLSDPTLL